MDLNKIKLGTSSLEVSRLAFGGWAIGGHRWGNLPSENEILKTIRLAVDLGINLFDTANIYGFGQSETLLGKVLGKKCPWPYREAKIATKFGLVHDELNQIRRDASRQAIIEQVEESLRRLNRDTIDLYQLHWPDPATPIGEVLETLLHLKDQGKIREFGASNLSVAEMNEAERLIGFATLQSPYSLCQRQIEPELLPWCHQHNIGVLAYSPLAKGLLSGKYGEQLPPFGKNDIRSQDSLFEPATYQSLYPKLRQFKLIAKELDTTPAALALAWVLHQPGVQVAITGIKYGLQLEENLQALTLKLDPEILTILDALFPNVSPPLKTTETVKVATA